MPYANVDGQNFTLALNATRVLDTDRLVRSKKHQVGDAIRALTAAPSDTPRQPLPGSDAAPSRTSKAMA